MEGRPGPVRSVGVESSVSGFVAGSRAVLDDGKLREDVIGAWRQAFYANTACLARSQKRRDVEVWLGVLRKGCQLPSRNVRSTQVFLVSQDRDALKTFAFTSFRASLVPRRMLLIG